MTEQEAVALFKCLADKSRLQILRSLAQEDMYVELLAERLNLSASTVSFHLKKLAEIGAVTSCKSQYYTMYSLHREVFNQTILSIIAQKPDEAEIQAQREITWKKKVLDSFFDKDGKLKTIPAQRKKRLIILEQLAQAFEPGKTYSEREVNIIIADYHDDFCTLRRELVDEGLMQRSDGTYQRNIQAS